jgi:hypothetical protein
LLGKSIGEMFGAAGTAPQFVETGKADAAVKPDPERPTITAETGSGGDEFEKCLLYRILGGGPIAEHAVREGSETVDGGFVDRPVGGVGPSTDPVDQMIQLVIVGQPCFLAVTSRSDDAESDQQVEELAPLSCLDQPPDEVTDVDRPVRTTIRLGVDLASLPNGRRLGIRTVILRTTHGGATPGLHDGSVFDFDRRSLVGNRLYLPDRFTSRGGGSTRSRR